MIHPVIAYHLLAAESLAVDGAKRLVLFLAEGSPAPWRQRPSVTKAPRQRTSIIECALVTLPRFREIADENGARAGGTLFPLRGVR